MSAHGPGEMAIERGGGYVSRREGTQNTSLVAQAPLIPLFVRSTKCTLVADGVGMTGLGTRGGSGSGYRTMVRWPFEAAESEDVAKIHRFSGDNVIAFHTGSLMLIRVVHDGFSSISVTVEMQNFAHRPPI